MKAYTLIITCIIAVAIMMGCNRTETTANALSGGSELLYKYQWNLLELGGQPMEMVKPPYIRFEQGDVTKVTGHTGCNNLDAVAELDNVNVMKFSAMATTKMACQGENIESAFLELLSKVDTWVITIDELSVYQGKDLLARFKGLPPDLEENKSEASPLNGRWELDSIAGSKLALGALYPAQKPFIAFNLPVMEIMGSTGCNAFTSALSVDSNHIEFINFTATEKACKDPGEPLFVNAIKQVSTFALIDSMSMTLSNDDGTLMRFVRK